MSSAAVDLRRDPVSRCFKHYLMPAITGMVIKSVYVIADLAFIGQSVGPKGLAAINIVIPYFTLIFAIAMCIGVGGSALMAIRFGEHREREGLEMFQQSISLTVLLLLLTTVLSLFNLTAIARLFGANDELLPPVMDYLGILILFATPYGFGWAMSSFIRNDGNPKLVMCAMVASASTNVFLDWLFMLPMGMGMKGAALATGIAQLAMVGILLTHFRNPNAQLKLSFVIPEWATAKKITSNGFPSFVMESAVGIVIMASNWVLLKLGGNLYISVYTIALNFTWVVVMLCYGVGQAAQPIISFNHGAGLNDRIQRILKYAFGLVTLIGFVIGLIALVFAEPIVAIFVNEPPKDLLVLGSHVLRLYALAYIPMGISLTAITLYQSVAKARYSTLISMLRALVFPLAGLFLLPALFTESAVWFNMLLAELAAAAISLFLLKGYLQSLKTPQETLSPELAA